MSPKKRNAYELGVVVSLSGAFRADISIREGENIRHIRGPRRGSQKRAFEDLLTIRAAAAEHTTRIGALQAMQQAAEGLKEASKAEAGRCLPRS